MEAESDLRTSENELSVIDMDISDSDNVINEEHAMDNIVSDMPKIGMLFDTVDDAKCYYNTYAKGVGFSIRVRRTNKPKGDDSYIRSVLFVCSCEGEYTKVKSPQKRRENKRFGCKAEFYVLFTSGKYKLTRFEENHTHELVPPDRSHLLRSQRQIQPVQALIIDQMRSAGFKSSEIGSYMRVAAGGAQNLNFTQVDCNNYFLQKRRQFLKEGDVNCLKSWFTERKKENRHFYSSFWTDDAGEVRGVFFCDAKSRYDYGLFGDVICFDTTFKTNNYNLVCAPIVGVNHHWQTTFFGCGLLEGETTEAIVWLFTTFLEVMGGKAPTVILTDQSAAIKSAIQTVFPNIHHRLCLWHIYRNAKKHLNLLVNFKCFSKQLKWCIFNPETVSEFEECWFEMLREFELTENTYLQNLYAKREEWALVYGRAYFSAGMTTTQRSEGINNFLKKFFGTTTILREFVEQYTKAMDNRRETERCEENRTQQSSPILFGTWQIEKEASKFYTKIIFYRFQEEYKKLGDLQLHSVSSDSATSTHSVVQLDGKGRPRILRYDFSTQLVSCSCRKFEFEGVICCHALKFYRDCGITSLPSFYYLKRWSRNITKDLVMDQFGEAIHNDIDPSVATRYSELSHITQRIVAIGATSSERCLEAKNTLLELEKRMVAVDIICDKLVASSYKGLSNVGDFDDDIILLNPKSKKTKGEQKSRKKSIMESKSRNKKKGRKHGDITEHEFDHGLTQNITLQNSNQHFHGQPMTLIGSSLQNCAPLEIVDPNLYILGSARPNSFDVTSQLFYAQDQNESFEDFTRTNSNSYCVPNLNAPILSDHELQDL